MLKQKYKYYGIQRTVINYLGEKGRITQEVAIYISIWRKGRFLGKERAFQASGNITEIRSWLSSALLLSTERWSWKGRKKPDYAKYSIFIWSEFPNQ